MIVENGSLVKEIKAMRDSKLETGDVKAVVDAAVRIGSENGLSARGAITKIVSDLQQSWDAKLGLELELQRLKEQKDAGFRTTSRASKNNFRRWS